MIHDLNMKVQEKIQTECTLHTARPTSGDQASWAQSKEAIREKPDRGNPWNVDDGEGADVSDDDDAFFTQTKEVVREKTDSMGDL